MNNSKFVNSLSKVDAQEKLELLMDILDEFSEQFKEKE